MKTSITIKSWAESDRPREKLIQLGRHNLSDAELLAILLGTGTASKSALDLSKELLWANANDLSQLGKQSLHDLKEIKGIGNAKAITLLAAFELGRRRKETEVKKKTKITSSSVVFDFMAPTFIDLEHEEFHALFLDRANQVLLSKQISIGGRSGTIADGKIIFKEAIQSNASGIILCHNHPSGQLTPSDADKNLTKQLVSFGKFIDLHVLDHLIFNDNNYFSFADNSLL